MKERGGEEDYGMARRCEGESGQDGESGMKGVMVIGASVWMVKGVSERQGEIEIGDMGILLPLFRERYKLEIEENPGASKASIAE